MCTSRFKCNKNKKTVFGTRVFGSNKSAATLSYVHVHPKGVFVNNGRWLKKLLSVSFFSILPLNKDYIKNNGWEWYKHFSIYMTTT